MATDEPSRVHVDAWGVITHVDPPRCERCGYRHWIGTDCPEADMPASYDQGWFRRLASWRAEMEMEMKMATDEGAAPLSAGELAAIAAAWQREDARASDEHRIDGSMVAIGRLLATIAARDAELERAKSATAYQQTLKDDAEFRLERLDRQLRAQIAENAARDATVAAYREALRGLLERFEGVLDSEFGHTGIGDPAMDRARALLATSHPAGAAGPQQQEGE